LSDFGELLVTELKSPLRVPDPARLAEVFVRPFLIALIACCLPLGAYAHHGWSSYDSTRMMKITAPLDDVKWENPHSMAYVTYEGKRVEVYLAPITRMVARGLEKDALAVGKTVTIEAYPSSSNANELRAERITVDGKTVELR
jgi:hypothetical protein